MTYSKNVWKDQDVQRPRTYEVINNQDGSITLNDSFGVVTELGTPVNAVNMNHIEDGIADNDTAITTINSKIPSSASSSNKMAVASDIAAINTALTLKADKTQLHALKGYLDDGTLLTDAEGLADVITYAHSTFDVSKFTVVDTPTITADGIMTLPASPTSYVTTGLKVSDLAGHTFEITYETKVTADYLTATDRLFGYYNNIHIEHKPLSGSHGVFQSVFRTYNTVTSTTEDITLNVSLTAEQAPVLNDVLFTKLGYDGTNYYMKVYKNGTLIVDKSAASANYLNSTNNYIQIGLWYSDAAQRDKGEINLKCFSVVVDGVEVFSGNKTGIDTYTIGGNTVTIPYTLSKTGSKIAGANSRTDVTAVYNQQGYSPYYTLDEANGNFTLPQGEIYGMMLNQSVPHVIESYKNGTSWYRVYSDGWCEQGGDLNIPGPTSGSVVFLKAYASTDYMIMLTNSDYQVNAAPGVSGFSQSQTGFAADYPSAEVTGTVYWATKGYINI